MTRADPFGFLIVDKPLGMTSHDVVAKIRRGTGVRRVGHAGTLDPLATGVLVICIGAATRLSEYVMLSSKLYIAAVQLGLETESYDAEGRVVAQVNASHLTTADVEAALARFNGEQDQTPPMHSAIKQGGQKLYDLARKGRVVERAARRVWMETLLLDDDLPAAQPTVQIAVACSAGTYIRSLAHDLGAALGVGGHLAALRRLRSGSLAHPVAWATLTQAMTAGDWPRFMVDERRALMDIPELRLDDQGARAVLHGQAVPHSTGYAVTSKRRLFRAYAPDSQFIAIVEHSAGQMHPVKVFSA